MLTYTVSFYAKEFIVPNYVSAVFVAFYFINRNLGSDNRHCIHSNREVGIQYGYSA